MASLALQLKPHHLKSAPTLTFSHLFSSSSSDNNGGNSPKPPNVSSYFSDIKSRLIQQEQQQQNHKKPFKFTPQIPSSPRKVASLDEIRKNLSEFRLRSSVPAPESSSPANSHQQPTLLQDIYKRNMAMSYPNPNPSGEKGTLSFESIRQSLRGLRKTQGENGNDPLSLNKYKDSFRLRPPMAESGGGSKVYGGGSLPSSVFGREMREREKKGDGKESVEDEMAKSELIRMYTHAELGEKLKELRPETNKREKFSFSELNERLKKLREMEEQQSRSGISYRDLRSSLQQIRLAEDKNKPQFPRIDMFGQLGGTPSFPLKPPKENLVEKYFHPDNMSSEEKLKLELKKVRDEFKMHESDCGSTRVQIAQLTTEILHLSSVLHKKDKHSRRGLIAKVQQRKKLLKYLRRTDWDSYCFVLSKLGLRDNPDYKN